MCFDPGLVAGLVSRMTRGGRDLDNTNGWIKCVNSSEKCFGLMHIPESYSPNVKNIGSIEHFKEGIAILIDKFDQVADIHKFFNDNELTRAAIAAYNCGAERIPSSGTRI